MKSQNETFLAVATGVAGVHDQITKQRDAYLLYRSRYFADDRNPFGGSAARKFTTRVFKFCREENELSILITFVFYEGEEKLTPLSVIASSAAPKTIQQQPQQQQQQQQTSLLGTSRFGQSTNSGFGNGGGGSLFGQPQQQQSSSLFGGAKPPSTSATPSLFGQSTNAFGGSALTNTTAGIGGGGGGGFGFGQSTTTPAQSPFAGGGGFGKK